MADKDDLAAAVEAFELCAEAETDNRKAALEDLRFARLGEQWPEHIRAARERDKRPVLTINRMPSFIRQVVNDSRQNRPQIKVKPVDNGADRDTAEIYTGLVRNIEYRSKADIAYDTAVDFSASMGFGYFRIAIDYDYGDSFNKCVQIKRVSDPFMVYGDPHSTEADSSDWNLSFVTEYMPKLAFERKYKGAEKVDWKGGDYADMEAPWRNEDDSVLVAEYWERDEVQSKLLQLSDGTVIGEREFKTGYDLFAMMGIGVVNERPTTTHRVRQRIMTGAEILETNDWAGCYIPIVPVYGEEITIEGKRHFRSLIRDAKDAQRQFNYWRTTATELVALAPRVPFIGEEGAFDADPNWSTANSENHAYLMYTKGRQPPQRMPLDSGPAAGALSEAMQSSDDMKAIMGLYDASLGQRSNETSGKAIMARQREGDNSTFHIIDNLARSIRHGGNIIIDLIPKVYTGERMIRILGEDGSEDTVKISDTASPDEPMQEGADETEQNDPNAKLRKVYNLGAGKYDVAVDVGPGYTTRREEARIEMTEVLRSIPELGQVAGDLIVKAFDWPQAEQISDRIKKSLPPNMTGEGPQIPPEVQQQIEQGMQQIEQMGAEIQRLQAEVQKKELDSQKKDVEIAEAQLDTKIASMSGDAMPGQPVAKRGAGGGSVAINMPEQIGGAIAETVANIIGPVIAETVAQSVAQSMASIPPLRVQAMRRVPVYGMDGEILETREEPMPHEMATVQ